MSLAGREGANESPAGPRTPEPADGLGQPAAHSTAGLRAVMEQLEKEISFREEVETELRDGRARLQAILDTAVDAIITIDERGAIESFNPAAARLFGYEAREVTGTNINRLMPSPYQESHDGYLASYLRTGEKKIIGIGREVTGKRKDDSVFPMDLSISEVVLGTRRIFTGIVRDVTERKRFEAELHRHIEDLKHAQQLTERQSEDMRQQAQELAEEVSVRKQVEAQLRDGRARLQAILDTAVDAIITIDERGAIESFNPAAAQLFGYEAQEVIGTNINRLMPSPYQESHDGYLASYLRTGEKKIIGIGREVTGKRKDDSVFPMDLSISEVVLGSRRIFTGIVRDVTERKTFEAELHQHIQNLKEAQQLTEHQGEHLRQQAEELAAQNKELEQFAFVASHDLQEPLRMIRSYTQLLAKRYKGRLDGEADEFISFVEDAVARMQQLITDLLSYSRVGRNGKEFASVDCETCVTRSLANLRIALEETKGTVERSTLPQVFGDSTQLTQLFQNLIGNALKYRAQVSPRIEVRAERQGREWLLAVSDNGIGIAPEHNERIFGMFQRLHGREEYPGTGIGLAICKKIVDQHGGRIWLESQPAKGSTFFFTLPAIEDEQ